ncbi:DMT family transporter [Planctomycetota bacterium]
MNKKHSSQFYIGAGAAFFAMACWGTVPVFMKYLTGYMDSWTMNMYRYGVAASLYIPFLAYYWKKGLLTRRLFVLSLYPTSVNIIGQILWAVSPYYLDPGLMGIFIKTSVIWSTASSFLFFKDERPLMKIPGFWIGTLLTFGSFIGMSVTELNLSEKASVTGLIVILTCSVFWGLYPVAVKMTLKKTNPMLSFGLICINTSVVLIILGCLKGEPGVITDIPLKAVSILIVSAIIGIALSHIAYYIALNAIGVVASTNITMATPLYTLILASIFLNVDITSGKIIFGAGIIAGVFLVTFIRHRINRTRNAEVGMRS